MTLIGAGITIGIIVFVIKADASSPTISHGDPAKHTTVNLTFSGQINGVMRQADNVVGETSLEPSPVDTFIPLTACSVLDLQEQGQDRGWVGEADIEGQVGGEPYSIRISTVFNQTGLQSLPSGMYMIDPSSLQYPSAYAALYSQDGKVGFSTATLESTFTVDSTGRSGELNIGFTDMPQKVLSTPALVTVKGTWSCG